MKGRRLGIKFLDRHAFEQPTADDQITHFGGGAFGRDNHIVLTAVAAETLVAHLQFAVCRSRLDLAQRPFGKQAGKGQHYQYNQACPADALKAPDSTLLRHIFLDGI